MTFEIFQGNPQALKDRLDAIKADLKTVNSVVPLSDKSWYLIMWS